MRARPCGGHLPCGPGAGGCPRNHCTKGCHGPAAALAAWLCRQQFSPGSAALSVDSRKETAFRAALCCFLSLLTAAPPAHTYLWRRGGVPTGLPPLAWAPTVSCLLRAGDGECGLPGHGRWRRCRGGCVVKLSTPSGVCVCVACACACGVPQCCCLFLLYLVCSNDRSLCSEKRRGSLSCWQVALSPLGPCLLLAVQASPPRRDLHPHALTLAGFQLL